MKFTKQGVRDVTLRVKVTRDNGEKREKKGHKNPAHNAKGNETASNEQTHLYTAKTGVFLGGFPPCGALILLHTLLHTFSTHRNAK